MFGFRVSGFRVLCFKVILGAGLEALWFFGLIRVLLSRTLINYSS